MRQPLLCRASNNSCMVYSPYEYDGNYTYSGENEITLHSTYGRFETYRKISIFGVPFMVCSRLTAEDVVLAAETCPKFLEQLIKAL